MPAGYNAFEPDDLALAQSVLDEVWIGLPAEVRASTQATQLRERLARRVLSALNNEQLGREELKATLLQKDAFEWA